MNIVKDVGFCDFCKKVKVNKTHYVYRIGFTTTKGEFNIGIMNIYEELSDYLMGRGAHLSASQVILLRPDILKDFLRFKFDNHDERLLNCYLCESEICKTCYEAHTKAVPER